jgi:hypothetical protein
MRVAGGRQARRAWLATPLLCLLIVSLGALSCSRRAAGAIQIALADDPTTHRQFIRVTGLSAEELSSLRTPPASADAWRALLDVRVTGAPLAGNGRFVAAADAVEFHTTVPFDAGRTYVVRVDPTHLPGPRTAAPPIERLISLPAPSRPPPARVTAIFPSADRWPSNLLRFYVHFSAPMSGESGVGRVHLLDARGAEVPDALLPSDVDFWNDDHTRYTVLFDPGRVKRGILPNRRMGRALVEGRQYAIQIDDEWHDASGQRLGERFRHEFVAGPAIEQPIDPGAWTITTPQAGTREAVVVRFPRMLDHALLQRALGIAAAGHAPIEGAIEINRDQTEWRFVPQNAWASGRYEVLALPILEDPAGNRIGRAFEALPGAPEASAERPEYRLPFQIGGRPGSRW